MHTSLLWIGFSLLIVLLLWLDLNFFHRDQHRISLKEALMLSLAWIALAGILNVVIWWWKGSDSALEFLTGYLIEKALSVDNVFVFLVIFRSFSVPPSYQHRVLFFGVLGALVMRGAFIIAGTALLQRFHWMIYALGFIVIAGAYKLLRKPEIEVNPQHNIIFRIFKRYIPAVEVYRGNRFFIKEDGRWLVTPLFFVLIAVEVTDLIFAMDSIPAIFAITRDPFIIFTSNIFAILGLRALYFLLASSIEKLRYLDTGLALILFFVGAKMLLSEVLPIPLTFSLLVIVTVLTSTVILSVWSGRKSGAGLGE